MIRLFIGLFYSLIYFSFSIDEKFLLSDEYKVQWYYKVQ